MFYFIHTCIVQLCNSVLIFPYQMHYVGILLEYLLSCHNYGGSLSFHITKYIKVDSLLTITTLGKIYFVPIIIIMLHDL